MDGRGRFVEPLKAFMGRRLAALSRLARHPSLRAATAEAGRRAADLALHADRLSLKIAAAKPRRAGLYGAAALVVGALGYGAVQGGHLPLVLDTLADARDQAANAAGFGIAEFAISGQERLDQIEILAAAGITGRTSLLFLDVDAVRRRLEASPWIAEATVRKLYPGRLEIAVRERAPFAVWQLEGRLLVIAADGKVLGGWGERALPALPLVVGHGAGEQAAEFLAALDRHPALREKMRAAVRVADRRWNLRLKNGLDIRLPEHGVAPALDLLMALDRDRRILSRDITAIDLRVAGRVSVRLSEEAAKAREEALKEQKKRRGGDA